MSEGAQDVQSSFGFSVYIVCMWFERHAAVVCDSKDFRGVVVGDWGAVKCNVCMGIVFSIVGCD